MTDEKIIYDCIINELYKNKIELEMILCKVADKRLIVGFLIDLHEKADKYEIDRKIPLGMLPMFVNIDDISGEKNKLISMFIDDNKYFTNKMKEILNSGKSFNSTLINLIGAILDDGVTGGGAIYEEELGKTDKVNLKLFKDYLIEKEMYEYVTNIDKYL